MLTKGISHVTNGISSTNSLDAMSKRTQKESGEERVTAKVETNDESGRAMQWKGSCRAIFYCTRKPGENQTRKSKSSESANWEVR